VVDALALTDASATFDKSSKAWAGRRATSRWKRRKTTTATRRTV